MRYETHEKSSIKTYALLGFIFYLLVTLGWLLFLFLAVLVIPWGHSPGLSPDIFPPVQLPTGVVSMLGTPVLVLCIIFTGLAYSAYKKIDEGRYADARNSTLFLGICGLLPFFGGFLGGIFFLLAYGNLGDTLRTTSRSFSTPQLSSALTPRSRFCTNCGKIIHPADRFCSRCGVKLT